MLKFIAGVLVTLLVQAVGWPAIHSTLTAAGAVVSRVGTAVQHEVSK